MKKMRRALALLLCAIMVVGLVPAGVLDFAARAEGETIYVLAGGDFQEYGDHSKSAENVSNILGVIDDKYTTMDGFLFIGDYDCETHEDVTETAAGITALMDTVQTTYSNINYSNSILVQGNHDYLDSRIDATGGHDFEGYSVFVLNEGDYAEKDQASEASIKALAAKMEDWLNTKLENGYSDPIFITSHLPLAYGPRTWQNGDGMYAKYLFDVLNAAGAAGLNIIFMHGHDHAYGADNYLGGEAIYLPKGRSINISEVGNQKAWTVETLNFTYMNAGYVGYYNESGYTPADTDDTKLTMTVFAITDGKVTVERYSAHGQYNMKSGGRDGYYSSTASSAQTIGLTYSLTDTYSSPQEIELTQMYTVTDAASSVSVTSKYDEAALGMTVNADVTVDALADEEQYLSYKAYAVSTTPSVETAVINIPVPTNYPLDYTVVYVVNSDGTVTKVDAEITMVAGSKVAKIIGAVPATYAVAVENESSEPETITQYVRVESVDQLVSGEQYLIVFDCSSQNTDDRYVIPTIATYNSGSSQRKGPDVVDAAGVTDSATIAVSDEVAAYEWTLTKSGSGWLIGNGTQNIAVSYNSTSSNYEWIFSDTGDVFTIASGMSNSPADANSYSFGVYNDDSDPVSWQYNTSATLVYGKLSDTYRSRFVFYKKTTTEVADPSDPGTAPAATIGQWVTVSESSSSSGTDYTYTLYTGSDWGGKNFLIAGSSSSYIMINNGSSLGRAAVTISSDGKTLTINNTREWTITEDNKITNGTYYLVFTGSSDWRGRPTANVSLSTDAEDASTWDIVSNGDGTYVISNTFEYETWTSTATATSYLYYSGSTFGVTTNNSNTLRLYGDRVDPVITETITMAQAEGDELYTISTSTTATAAMNKVKAGITVYTSTDGGVTRTAVDDDDVDFTWVDTYTGDMGYYTVDVSYEGKSLGTVEVLAASTGEGTNNGWVQVQEAGNQYKYVLDTNGYETGSSNRYLVVGSSASVALSSTVPNPVGVTITDGTTIIMDTRSHEWYIESYNNGDWGSWCGESSPNEVLYNGSARIDDSNMLLNTSSSPAEWDITHNGDGQYNFRHSGSSAYWYMYYNGEAFGVSSSDSATVRLFKYDGTVTVEALYASIEGPTAFTVGAGAMTEAQILKLIQNSITGYVADNADGTDKTALADDELTWTWVDEIDPNTQGYYTMAISYKGQELGTVEVFVEKKAVSVYALSSEVGYVNQNASQYTVVKDADGNDINVIIQYTDGTTATVPLTVSMIGGSTITSTKEQGTFDNLVVEYKGYGLTDDFVLHVTRNTSGNDYPEYPEPGAVDVDKQADATYLQQTGVVKVELSTSGIPVKNGLDVVVVVDTSSSMKKDLSGNSIDSGSSTKSRVQVLAESMNLMFDEFTTADATTGLVPDIDVAVVDFNGYGAEYANLVGSLPEWEFTNYTAVYTGNHTPESAGAFVKATTLADVDWYDNGNYSINEDHCHSGTNYDGGLSNAYRLLEAKKIANQAAGETRDQYVIFLSDGAPFGWNGVVESDDQGATGYYWWNLFLQGDYAELADMNTAAQAHATFTTSINTQYQFLNWSNGTTHPNRWAEAIKGDSESYTKVLGNVSGDVATEADMINVLGMDATVYSIGFGLAEDSRTTNNNKGAVTEETMTELLKTIASEDQNGEDLYWEAQTADDLDEAFTQIAAAIRYAATDAYFVDKMGASVNLQMTSTVNKRDEEGNLVQTALSSLPGAITPQIQVLNYKIYLASDVGKTINGVEVTEAMVGERYGAATVIETVTFDDDGNGTLTAAYSTLIDGGNTNILADGTKSGYVKGVIYAKNFLYNTNNADVQVTVAGKTYTVAAESFRWNIGTINNVEWALSYYVYLEGSMEGETAAGSYATNEYATLYYKNWLGNDAFQGTTSPSAGWKSANVSYAFYLVNDQGQPVVNQTTGQTGSFYNAVQVTQPVVFQEILLNNLDEINTIEAASSAILPEGYDLYDNTASYKVVILSEDGKGSWTITSDPSKVQSSYVTGHYGSYASNEALVTSNQAVSGTNYTLHTDYDYTHTTVWFAVVWVPKALPDAVVMDYGLPVDISVLANDQFGDNGSLFGIGTVDAMNSALSDAAADVVYTDHHDSAFGGSLELTYGSAKVNANKVTYTPTPKSMTMNGYDQFAYEVKYDYNQYDANGQFVAALGTQYYYGTVTVIPATTVYYEDTFLTLDSYTVTPGYRDETGVHMPTSTKDNTSAWNYKAVSGINQDEDRPGFYSLYYTDANNVYGYDGTYENMTTHSLQESASIEVSSTKKGTATFSFYGTGFDVISLTSNTTGTLMVDVYNGSTATGKPAHTYMVDTYYGYTLSETDTNGDGELNDWILSPNDPTALYQVPVMKVSGMPYGQYTVVITAAYSSAMDHNNGSSYTLYLDAIRIYDPAGTTYDVKDADGNVTSDGNIADVIQDAYKADGEAWPKYEELRNNVIDASGCTVTYNSRTMTYEVTGTDAELAEGAIFIDSENENYNIADYVSYGPNNELYLAAGQSVAFQVADYQIGGKSIVANVMLAAKSATGAPVDAKIYYVGAQTGVILGEWEKTFTTTTDMYEKITSYRSGIIVVSNIGESGILSLTNIKMTFTADPTNATIVTGGSGDSNGEGTDPNTVSEQGDPNEGIALSNMTYMTYEGVGRVLTALNVPPVVNVPEEETPEVEVPEVNKPEATDPPAATNPPATTNPPAATNPPATTPVATEPAATDAPAAKPESGNAAQDKPVGDNYHEDKPSVKPEPEAPEVVVPEVKPEAAKPQNKVSAWDSIIEMIINAFSWLFGWMRF